MFLLDTNIWLERLLGQDRSEDVGEFLDRTPSDQLHITDFSLHSMGVVLTRFNQPELLASFVSDIFVDGAVHLVRLDPEDTQAILDPIARFRLDFDDAYQYVAAQKFRLTFVSFDADFDRTDLERKTPAEI